MIEIYHPGQKVMSNGVEVTVLQVLLDSTYDVSYKCSWWAGNDRKEQWLKDFELEYKRNADRTQIGFFNPEQSHDND